jgi:uncharacterized protein YkwD
LHRSTFALVVMALVACKPDAATRAEMMPDRGPIWQTSCAPPPGSDEIETFLLSDVNRARLAHCLRPLRAQPRLSLAAQMQACDNAARGALSHTGMDGSGVGARAARAGYSYRMVAENLGLGVTSASAAVQGWMASPGHRANLLKPEAVEAGMGLATTDQGRFVWALVVGAPR